ncbi:unnamed protein product [Closterium sp. NIES-54]
MRMAPLPHFLPSLTRCSSSLPYSPLPFESNVIYNFELMKCIFDYAFDRLGVEGGGRVNHPVLLTEAPCAPLYTRGKTAELMFETYGVPALGTRPLYTRGKPADLMFETYGVPALGKTIQASLACHGVEWSGVVWCGVVWCGVVWCGVVWCGVVGWGVVGQMIAGQPLLDATCRIPVGGWHVTDYLKRLLTLLYPQHAYGPRLRHPPLPPSKLNHPLPPPCSSPLLVPPPFPPSSHLSSLHPPLPFI